MEPGTALAIASLGIQVAEGIQKYFSLLKDCDHDITELRNSLPRIETIFEHLKKTLRRPGLERRLVATICLSIKACEGKIEELESILKKFKKDGTPEGLLEKLKTKSRRALYPFRASTISRISEVLEDMKDDLRLVLDILSLETGASTNEKLDTITNGIISVNSKVDGVAQALEAESKASWRKEIYEWLAPPDVTSAHISALEKRHPATGMWFLESTEFETWKSQPGSRLWLYGGGEYPSLIMEYIRSKLTIVVGSGKTVLWYSISSSLLCS